MARKRQNNTGANLGFEEKLWQAADKMRGHMDAAEYTHVVLGLVFLKYIGDAFEEFRAKLATIEGANVEDRDESLAENVFWFPEKARWSCFQSKARKAADRVIAIVQPIEHLRPKPQRHRPMSWFED